MATLNISDIRPQIVDGLAIYDLGHGVGQEGTVLLLPDQAESWTERISSNSLALLFLRLGKRVVSFDPPSDDASPQTGASDRPSRVPCALATLRSCGVNEPVDVVARDSSSIHALMLAHAHSEQVKKVVLVGDATPELAPLILEQISTPVLIYVGERELQALERATTLAEGLLDSRVVVCPRGGPRPDEDAPLHFGATLRHFLDADRPGPITAISVEM